MKKKVIALFVTCVLVSVNLAGCNKEAGADTHGDQPIVVVNDNTGSRSDDSFTESDEELLARYDGYYSFSREELADITDNISYYYKELNDYQFDSMAKNAAVEGIAFNGMAVEEAPAMDMAAAEESAAEVYDGENRAMVSFATGPADMEEFFDEPASFDTSEFKPVKESGFINASNTPLSTFGADVDTASYCILRSAVYNEAGKRFMLDKIRDAYDEAVMKGEINENDWKHDEPFIDMLSGDMDYSYGYVHGLDLDSIKDSIRVEEAINYFDYDYKKPEGNDKFSIDTEIAKCPWNNNLLLKIGVKAVEYDAKDLGSNVVLLVDVSGSMFEPNKLPLVKRAIDILSENFTDKDRISIVTYAGSDEILLDSVPGNERRTILRAIDNLDARGSTNGAAGIKTAYELAEKNFIKDGNNRVILMTDGDFNVGQSSEAELVSLIEKERDTGVFLSVCGFGDGNYSDVRMEALADNGNGNYDYIDWSGEAEKFFRNEFESTMYAVAKDVKFQVDFNPALVKAYRQIGYENRQMAAEDFADDTKDGGEVGSGQTVTVLYELVPACSDTEAAEVSSEYVTAMPSGDDENYCTVHLRYKEPDENESTEVVKKVSEVSGEISDDLSFIAGVAQGVMLISGSDFVEGFGYKDVIDRLSGVVGDDEDKTEFVFMLKQLTDDK